MSDDEGSILSTSTTSTQRKRRHYHSRCYTCHSYKHLKANCPLLEEAWNLPPLDPADVPEWITPNLGYRLSLKLTKGIRKSTNPETRPIQHSFGTQVKFHSNDSLVLPEQPKNFQKLTPPNSIEYFREESLIDPKYPANFIPLNEIDFDLIRQLQRSGEREAVLYNGNQ